MAIKDSENQGDPENKGTFVVKDRRRFDDQGNERADEPKSAGSKSPDSTSADTMKTTPKLESKTQPSQSKPAPRSPEMAPSSSATPATDFSMSTTADGAEQQEINFASFVISLATQALMQLGEVQPPPGVELPVDRVAAKQTIDILTMLEQKTKGNLDKEEARLMEEVLHTLRLSFVRVSR